MNNNLLMFLLTVLVIVVVAWLWPTQGADEKETLNSQDWRIQDLKDTEQKDSEK